MKYTNIHDFHVKNGYYVRVIPEQSKQSCSVVFPNNLLENNKYDISILYEIDQDEKTITKYLTIQHRVEKTVVHADKYVMRTLIVEDIIIITSALKIALEFIIMDNNADVTEVTEAFDVDLTEQETIYEKTLFEELVSVLTSNVKTSLLEDEVLAKGYQQMITCFEEGGL